MSRNEERIATYFPNEERVVGSGTGSNNSAGKAKRQDRGTTTGSSTPTSQSSSSSPLADAEADAETTIKTQPQQQDKAPVAAAEYTGPPPSTFQSRLWKVLLSNFDRSVDEFYYLCEEEGNEDKCREMIALLDRTSHDFVKLIERITEQRKFDLDPARTTGVSWEVRKPTRSGAVRSSVSLQGSPKTSKKKDTSSSPMSASSDVSSASATSSSRLRAAATPFQPSFAIANSVAVSVSSSAPAPAPEPEKTAPASVDSDAAALPKPAPAQTATVASITVEQKDKRSDSVVSSTLSIETGEHILSQRSLTPGVSPLSATGSDAALHKKQTPTKKSRNQQQAAGTNTSAKQQQAVAQTQRSPTRADEWDADTEAQVVLASEQVWAEAEAWVEAEAAAEEEAWLKMREGGNKENRSKTNNRGKPLSSSSNSKGALTPPGLLDGKLSLLLTASAGDDDAYEEISVSAAKRIKRRLLTSPAVLREYSASSAASSESLIHQKDAAPETNVDDDEDDDDDDATELDSPTSLHVLTKEEKGADADQDLDRILMSDRFNFGNFRSGANSSSSVNGSKPSTPANSGHSTPHTGSSMRSLHEKLSSPDRRRALSPSEAKRKHEARQIAAESNRDRSVNERIQKAMIASVRVKLRSEKEAQRLAQAEQALEDRLKDAEKRHGEHIKNIRGKAGNENAKVSEVMFINNLNDEGIAEELQRRLEEAEARILAAGQRRQERLSSILEKGKRKSSRKSQQMSALRLQLETKKMERWSKLQSRLEAVQKRREARLEEMKRRSDEQAALDAVEALETTPTAAAAAAAVVGAISNAKGSAAAAPLIEDKAETKKAKKKNGNKKLSEAELQEARDEEILAMFISDKATATTAITSSSSSHPETEKKGAAEAPRVEAEEPFVWTGPGGVDDGSKADLESAFKTLTSLQSKRIVAQARIAALLGGSDEVKSSGGQEEGSGNPRVSSDWPEKGDLLNQILSATAAVETPATLSNEATLVLSALGYLPPSAAAPDAAAASKKKKKGPRPLSSDSIIVEPDSEDASRVTLTQRAVSGLGRAFSSVVDGESAAKFVSGGGVVLCRLFFGTEVGVLSSHAKCSAHMGGASFNAACKAVALVCGSPEGRDKVLCSGLGVLLADAAHLLLLQVEVWWKTVKNQRRVGYYNEAGSGVSSGAVLADAELALSEAEVELRTSSDEASATASFSNTTQHSSILDKASKAAKSAPRVAQTWLETQSSSLPSLLKTLEVLAKHAPASGQAKASQDAWAWHTFASGLAQSLSSGMQTLRSIGKASCKDLFLRSLSCRLPQLVSGLASLLRLSSGLQPTSLVTTYSALGSRKHSHPRGTQMVSILRSSSVTDTLVLLLENFTEPARPVSAALVSSSAAANNATPRLSYANLGVCASLVRALVSLAALDIGLIQRAMSEACQNSLACSIDLLLRALLEPYWTAENAKCNSVSQNAAALDPHDFDAPHAAAAINQLLALVGYCCVRNATFQKQLSRPCKEGLSTVPTLVFLCKAMPPNYYLHEHYRNQLLPTLAAMCTDCPEAKTILKREIDCGLINTHLASLARDLEEYRRKSAEDSALQPKANLVEVSTRLPTDMWVAGQV